MSKVSCSGCGQVYTVQVFPLNCSCGVSTGEDGSAYVFEYPPPDKPPCLHIGEILREAPCKLCGGRDGIIEVYACSVHRECTMRKYRFGQPEQSCASCEDYAPAPI